MRPRRATSSDYGRAGSVRLARLDGPRLRRRLMKRFGELVWFSYRSWPLAAKASKRENPWATDLESIRADGSSG